MKLMGEFSEGQTLYLAESLPQWIIKYLGKHLKKDLNQKKAIKDMSIEEVRRAYEEYKKKTSGI
ncbi:MAG TPA: hypothetical protein VN958_06555 [Chitinophagaceae bacterium]|nr:hypothetical protein [Chitinophagaceae bacterium]